MKTATNSTRAVAMCLLAMLCGASVLGCQSTQIAIARRLMAFDPPDVSAGTTVIRNIEFARHGGTPLLLDVYRPTDPEGELPIILYFFGGGWMSGDRHQLELLDLLRFVDAGYALVTADYRWSTEAPFPAQIHDVKAAIRWVREEAGRQGFDADRIALLGASAGGHLASLAGTSAGVLSLAGPREQDGRTSERNAARVAAVVDFFGPSDLRVYEAQHRANGLGNSNRLWFIDLYMGGPVSTRLDLVRMANPIPYADPDDPPFLIIHGEKDPIVPIQQSEDLARGLRAARMDVTFRVIPGGDHGRSDAFKSERLFNEILDFLDRVMPRDPATASERP